ncbi:hypothetical protein ACHAWF_010351 [Thalassiosira exigua]
MELQINRYLGSSSLVSKITSSLLHVLASDASWFFRAIDTRYLRCKCPAQRCSHKMQQGDLSNTKNSKPAIKHQEELSNMSLTFWNPNSVFAGFDDDFFNDPMVPSSFFGVPPALTRFKTDTMRHSSPRYEATENDKQFRLAVDVPGVKPDHLKVELENDGRVLHMSGDRKVKTSKSFEEYKFDKRFTLGNDMDASKITAHLSDGVLVLAAPKKEKLPPVKHEITIVQGEAPNMDA